MPASSSAHMCTCGRGACARARCCGGRRLRHLARSCRAWTCSRSRHARGGRRFCSTRPRPSLPMPALPCRANFCCAPRKKSRREAGRQRGSGGHLWQGVSVNGQVRTCWWSARTYWAHALALCLQPPTCVPPWQRPHVCRAAPLFFARIRFGWSWMRRPALRQLAHPHPRTQPLPQTPPPQAPRRRLRPHCP